MMSFCKKVGQSQFAAIHVKQSWQSKVLKVGGTKE
jgi:hypothetical protein